MMVMDAFTYLLTYLSHNQTGKKFSSHSFVTSGTQPFDQQALESKLSLIGLNRLIIDQAQRCVNFTPVKINVEHNKGQTAFNMDKIIHENIHRSYT